MTTQTADDLALMFAPDAEPLANILNDTRSFLSRFVSYPDTHALVAHVLWIAHAHVMDAWESTPRLGFLSPEPGSGKTRALEVTELLVPNPVSAVNVTPAYLFRKVGDQNGRPTIQYDEIDTVFGPKAKDNEEIRGLLNAGHRRGAVAGRCVVRGKLVETEEIPAYCAVVLAGLGGLPDTILTRTIAIRMKRRAPDEYVEPFRRRLFEAEGFAIRDRLATWAIHARPRLTDAIPELPPTLVDRHADVWEPLIAIADDAGDGWPELARCSGVAFVAASMEGTPSLGVRLLTDLRTAFDGAPALATSDLITALKAMEDAPWGDLYGKPIDARGLAQRLRPYGVKPTNIRQADRIVKGYQASDFFDSWNRYLSPLGSPPKESATSATPLHPDSDEGDDVADDPGDVADDREYRAGDRPPGPCSDCGEDAWTHRTGNRWLCSTCRPAVKVVGGG